MGVKNYTITKWTEKEIDFQMTLTGIPGYSERYYTNKRSYDVNGKEAWAVDVTEYYG